jgi:hypothetical protein
MIDTPVGFVVRPAGSRGIVLDSALARIWLEADGKTISQIGQTIQDLNADELACTVLALRVAGCLVPPVTVPVGPLAPVPDRAPVVSVVIPSHNGLQHLRECIDSLAVQRYPRIEIIVVDDRSTDGTTEYMAAHHPEVKVLRQKGGPNFAAACNLGISQAAGDLILLLNNDTVLEPTAVAQLVAAQSGQPDVGGVAAMMRFYDNPAFVNGLGTYVPARGHGYDLGIGSLDLGQFDQVAEVPLLCFGAALLTRDALSRVGPLDESYEFYYEDADWSYRARASGLRLLAAPSALVYHKFGASTNALHPSIKVRTVTRNRLRFAVKNLPAGAALARVARNAVDDAREVALNFSLGHLRVAWSFAAGWWDFFRQAPGAVLERRRLWRMPGRMTVDLDRLASPFPGPEMQAEYPRLTIGSVLGRYRAQLDRLATPSPLPRLLIVSPDVVGANMGGVGMRYTELARALSRCAVVTLAAPQGSYLAPSEFAFRAFTMGDCNTLRHLVDSAEIILLSGALVYHHPFLRQVGQYLVVDLYDPTVLENLERFRPLPLADRNGLHETELGITRELLALGDFFLCASERQRDYWLGALTTVGRVNPETRDSDPCLRRLIDVVPFGIPDIAPQHSRQVLKGVHPGIGPDDRVVLWGGGLWDWLDPLTLVDAMPDVLRAIPQVRLFFMGTRHPNPAVPASAMAKRTKDRADSLGLTDHAVFFNDWVPYADRADYLLEADVGVSLHPNHAETRFSVRTRLLDYMWAGLPMVVSAGDTLSEVVARYKLGRVVAPGDAAQVAAALVELLGEPRDQNAFAEAQAQFRWSRVARPLADYVSAPWRNGVTRGGAAVTCPLTTLTPRPLRQLPGRIPTILRERGLAGLGIHAVSYLRHRLRASAI